MKYNEQDVQNIEKLKASKAGGFLTRNNSGCFQDDLGRVIRYGLFNESHKINTVMKSSDLIGGVPITITEEMVGQQILQFIAAEAKSTGWTYKGTSHEKAQLNFINYINKLGGRAYFTTGE